MKKLLRALVLIAVFLVGAASWKGWKLFRQAIDELEDEEFENEDVTEIIGSSDGPSAIVIGVMLDERSVNGIRGVFNRVALFFCNHIYMNKFAGWYYNRRKTTRKAEPQ